MHSQDFCSYTVDWCKKYLVDESIHADHEDLLTFYSAFIEDLKNKKIHRSKYYRELEIRRIIDQLLADMKTTKFTDDHLVFLSKVDKLDRKLKGLVHVSEKGLSDENWWKYSFI